MLNLFGVLNTGLLRPSAINIDNNVCKLHHMATVVLLMAFSLLVTGRQYIGDPIKCMSSSKIPQNLLDQYCWISATFTLSNALNRRVGFDVAYPGVGQYRPSDDVNEERTYHQYYQWVCFVLFLQALMFYVPHYLWKMWEAGRLKTLVSGLNSIVDVDSSAANKRSCATLVRYFEAHLRHHNFYFASFLLCETLNLINVVGQIYLTDRFLGGEFTTYGADVVRFVEISQEQRTDPMIRVFPRVTKCTFHNFGPSGDVQRHDALCILPINICNEKIYVFLWFWFVGLSAVTGMQVAYRLLLVVFPRAYCFLLRMHVRLVHPSLVDAISRDALVGDWFLLHQLSKNMERTVFTEFLTAFAESLQGKSYIENNVLEKTDLVEV